MLSCFLVKKNEFEQKTAIDINSDKVFSPDKPMIRTKINFVIKLINFTKDALI